MASEIKEKFGSPTALTITLASLATSVVGVGQQSTLIDNSSVKASRIKLYILIKQGTSPVGNKAVYVYFIRGDGHGTPYRTDGAGASDAGITVLNASLAGVMRNKSSPTTGDVLYGEFEVWAPGPEWGIAIVHDTGVDLDSTAGNHFAHYITVNPESQ